MTPGPYALGQQVSPPRSRAAFGTVPLPKELQRVFLTPFKQDTGIHSLRPSRKHPAWVGQRYEARTRLHQRGALQPGSATSPAEGTTNHHVLVKGESTVLSRQSKLNLKAEIMGNSFLFFFRGELWCL